MMFRIVIGVSMLLTLSVPSTAHADPPKRGAARGASASDQPRSAVPMGATIELESGYVIYNLVTGVVLAPKFSFLGTLFGLAKEATLRVTMELCNPEPSVIATATCEQSQVLKRWPDDLWDLENPRTGDPSALTSAAVDRSYVLIWQTPDGLRRRSNVFKLCKPSPRPFQVCKP